MATSKSDTKTNDPSQAKSPTLLFQKLSDDCEVMEIPNVGCVIKSGSSMVFVPQARIEDGKLTA